MFNLKKNIVTLVFISIASCYSYSFAQIGKIDTAQSINRKIIIASEPSYPPYCFVNNEGKADGFAVELFLAAAEAANLDVEIHIGLWDVIKNDLAEGKIDALPFVGRTPERENIFDFTLPYLSLHGAVFVKKGDQSISSLTDLINKRVGVMRGDNAEEFVIRNNISNHIISTNTFEEAFYLLDQNEVDAVISQRVMGIALLKTMKMRTIVPLNFHIPNFRQDFCFAVKKGNYDLLSRLNEGLSIIIANKTYYAIHSKWITPETSNQLSIKKAIEIAITILIPITIVFILVFILFLRREVKRRTSELSQSNKFLTDLIENSGSVIYTKSLTGNYQTVNRKWEELMGFTRESTIGFTDEQLFEENIAKQFRDNDLWVIKNRKSLTVDEEFKDATKTEYFISTKFPLWDEHNKISGICGISTNITDRKRNEEAIKISENNFKEIFNSTNEAIIIQDVNANSIVDVNYTTVHMYGYSSKQEMLNCTILDLSSNIPPYTNEAAIKHIDETSKSGKQTFEWHAKKKNGELFWVEVSLRYAEINKKERIIAVIRDIQQRKDAEEELSRLNKEIIAIYMASKPLQHLSTPKKLSDDIIVVLDKILNYDFGAILLVDYDGSRLIPYAISSQGKGEHFVEKDKMFIESKDIKVGKGIIGWVIENAESLLINDVTQDPRYFPMRKNIKSELCVPIIVESKVIGAINIESTKLNAYTSSDQKILETMASQIGIAIQNANLYEKSKKEIEERIIIENKLKELNEELENIVKERTKALQEQVTKLDKSQDAMLYMVEDLNDISEELKVERRKLEIINKELESFSYSVSHDLRAPLRAIDGFSQILQEEYEKVFDDEGKRLLKIIRENSQRMDKLITDLLALSRVTRNQLSKSKIDMTSMVKSMYNELVDDNEKKNINFIVHNLPSTIADPTLMRQVWQNLIGNAVKYSRPKNNRTIEVGFEVNEKNVTYYIKDNGVGFNTEYTHKIFETFQRLHKANEFEGTGIGLSIVQRIVHRHGGEVWAKGTEGEGATFGFLLPKSDLGMDKTEI